MGDYDSDGGGLPLAAILAIGLLVFLYIFVIDPVLKWAKDNPLLFMSILSTTFVFMVLLVMSSISMKMHDTNKSGGNKSRHVSYHGPEPSGLGVLFSGTKQYGTISSWWKPHGMQILTNIPFKVEEEDQVLGLFKFLIYPFTFFFNFLLFLKNSIFSAFQNEKNNANVGVDLLQVVAESINRYKPSSHCIDESEYSVELIGWLKKSFPKLTVELPASQNKPNIMVEKIAIELQRHSDLNLVKGLLEKCPKYSSEQKDLVVVIFEARFNEEKYEKMLSDLKKSFDNVVLVLKY